MNLKSNLCLLVLLFSFTHVLHAQVGLDYSKDPSTKEIKLVDLSKDGNVIFNVAGLSDASAFDDFMKNTKLTFRASDNSLRLEKSLEDYAKDKLSDKYSAFRDSVINAKGLSAYSIPLSAFSATEKEKLSITAKVKAGTLAAITTNIVATGNGAGRSETPQRQQDPIPTTLTFEQYIMNASKEGFDLETIVQNESRYDKAGNKAYLIVDQNGELFGNYPVNIDQDDIVYVVIIGEKNKIANYTADFTGTYAPVDLQMRTATAIDPGFKNNSLAPGDWDFVVIKRGPFTSENVIIRIKRRNAGAAETIATYTLAVNKLFHLGFGLSFNRTRLENPDFEITSLNSTTNTLTRINGGDRTLISFNTIWYWSSTVRYLARGSNITRGRDVLKEPGFAERINPTFGISLDSRLTDNIFVGLTFEFARGGTLVGGYHFGKVKRLAIPNFELDVTPFTGGTNDIKTSSESDKALYFGLMLDTRIFNTLFKRGQ